MIEEPSELLNIESSASKSEISISYESSSSEYEINEENFKWEKVLPSIESDNVNNIESEEDSDESEKSSYESVEDSDESKKFNNKSEEDFEESQEEEENIIEEIEHIEESVSMEFLTKRVQSLQDLSISEIGALINLIQNRLKLKGPEAENFTLFFTESMAKIYENLGARIDSNTLSRLENLQASCMLIVTKDDGLLLLQESDVIPTEDDLHLFKKAVTYSLADIDNVNGIRFIKRGLIILKQFWSENNLFIREMEAVLERQQNHKKFYESHEDPIERLKLLADTSKPYKTFVLQHVSNDDKNSLLFHHLMYELCQMRHGDGDFSEEDILTEKKNLEYCARQFILRWRNVVYFHSLEYKSYRYNENDKLKALESAIMSISGNKFGLDMGELSKFIISQDSSFPVSRNNSSIIEMMKDLCAKFSDSIEAQRARDILALQTQEREAVQARLENETRMRNTPKLNAVQLSRKYLTEVAKLHQFKNCVKKRNIEKVLHKGEDIMITLDKFLKIDNITTAELATSCHYLLAMRWLVSDSCSFLDFSQTEQLLAFREIFMKFYRKSMNRITDIVRAGVQNEAEKLKLYCLLVTKSSDCEIITPKDMLIMNLPFPSAVDAFEMQKAILRQLHSLAKEDNVTRQRIVNAVTELALLDSKFVILEKAVLAILQDEKRARLFSVFEKERGNDLEMASYKEDPEYLLKLYVLGMLKNLYKNEKDANIDVSNVDSFINGQVKDTLRAWRNKFEKTEEVVLSDKNLKWAIVAVSGNPYGLPMPMFKNYLKDNRKHVVEKLTEKIKNVNSEIPEDIILNALNQIIELKKGTPDELGIRAKSLKSVFVNHEFKQLAMELISHKTISFKEKYYNHDFPLLIHGLYEIACHQQNNPVKIMLKKVLGDWRNDQIDKLRNPKNWSRISNDELMYIKDGNLEGRPLPGLENIFSFNKDLYGLILGVLKSRA